jgi:hypothetical protein
MSFPDTTTQYTAFSNAAVATYLANYDGGINFTASPAVITGLGNISSANFTFANGVNILSTVTDLYANAAVQSANIATLFSNAATQATSINTINNTLTSSNVGIGAGAGSESQGTSAVAVGSGAGSLNQGLYSVAIGNDAGADNQGDRSVAVGTGAGRTNQGDYAVAIGRNAGYTNQGNNSIIINATTGMLNQITANTFTVAPVRNDVANVAQILFYNTTNKEITYGNTINIAGNINAAQYNFANGVNILSTVGAGAYGNTQVASYLLNFDGDIEFTSSTAKIGNVDVITVGDHIRSPAYQFSNGTSIFDGITGGGTTYSNTNVASYLTTATITTTGNITAGNLTATGTFTVANITTTGAYGNITGANVISANTVSATNYLFANGVNILSNVVTRFESTWTVPTGNSTQSFTVGAGETYYMWVDCNIPNGIIAWNATATVTNTNVPVVGAQYAWVYTGNGTPIDFTSIPNQFVGTANTIVRSSVAPSATTNRFDFGINNASGNAVTVNYGYTKIS